MKIPKIADAVGYLDEDLISGAAGEKKKRKAGKLKWGAAAACFVLALTVGIALLPALLHGNVAASSEGADTSRKGVAGFEDAILWPWEYLTVYERYARIEVNGVVYEGQMREIGASLLADCIGSYEGWGYEDHDDTDPGKEHRETFSVYAIRGVSSSDDVTAEFVAVEMEGKYYVFRREAYAPPATLGELMASVDLPEVLKLKGFSKNGDGIEEQYFTLGDDTDGAYIWEVLSGCADAKYVEDTHQTWYEREHISFGVTSEALGIYKKTFTITADGYLATNAFEWGYLFEIGEEAAGTILAYVETHSVHTGFVPYRRSVAGKVTEIADTYLIVDDSILYPAAGRKFKIPLDDLRIRRYVECGVVEIGDTIAVEYEGEIDPKWVVHGAVSISRGRIVDGDVLIPE